MKNFTSVLAMLLAVLLLFTACAANNANGSGETETVTTTATKSTVRIQRIDTDKLQEYAAVKALLKDNQNSSLSKPETYKHIDSFWFDSDKPNTFLHIGGKALVPLNESIAYPFLEVCADMQANPFRNFNTLVQSKKVIPTANALKQANGDVLFDFGFVDFTAAYKLHSLASTPEKTAYAYTKEGCEAFVQAVIALAKTNTVETPALLTEKQYPLVHFSQQDNCYYGYLLQYGTSYGYGLAIYFRSDDGKNITDVTLQTMRIAFPSTDYSAGVSIGMSARDADDCFEVVSLITAIEQLLAGDAYIDVPLQDNPDLFGGKYTFPSQYTVGVYTASLQCETYQSVMSNGEKYYYDTFTNFAYSLRLQ